MERITLTEKLRSIDKTWSPRIIAALNGQHVKLARLHGEFVRHTHEHEDELFLVLSGELDIEFDDRTVTLGAGEMVVVPRGVRHRPIAREMTEVLLFEPEGTLNTGDASPDERTVEDPDWI